MPPTARSRSSASPARAEREHEPAQADQRRATRLRRWNVPDARAHLDGVEARVREVRIDEEERVRRRARGLGGERIPGGGGLDLELDEIPDRARARAGEEVAGERLRASARPVVADR